MSDAKDAALSQADATLDALVSKASKPTLATLFKKAKEKGLITSITHYGPGKEKPRPPLDQPEHKPKPWPITPISPGWQGGVTSDTNNNN